MSDKDGGPAFPHEVPEDLNGRWSRHFVAGMTLRDYFAAAALTGLVSRGEKEYYLGNGFREKGNYIQDTAYRLADAMIFARENK